jgi:hypothetical protein
MECNKCSFKVCLASWVRQLLAGMVVLLQKVLQLYAARALLQRGSEGDADGLLNEVLEMDEEAWSNVIESRALAGQISELAFMEALQRRMEGTVLNLPSGSYAQRVQAEFLKELEARAKGVFSKIANSTGA